MAGGDDSVMWLRVKDEDIDAAERLRVKVSTTGSGKKRWFVCTGTLYKGKDDHMREYSRAQKKVKADPRNDEGLQLELQRGMMAIFRKQKRDREADKLVDSGRSGAAEADDLVRRLEGLRLLFGEFLIQAEGALQYVQGLQEAPRAPRDMPERVAG